jgi:ABC-type transport system involved in cytochrome c biogenesis permease subunit
MKKWLVWLVAGVFVLELALALRPKRESGFHLRSFASLPVLLNGRVQPLDSVARNALLQIRGTQSVPLEGNAAGGRVWGAWETIRERGQLEERQWWQFHKHPKRLKASDWLVETLMRPDLADDRYIFLVHHPELLSILKLEGKGVEKSGLHYFTFNELRPQFPILQEQSERLIDHERRHQVDPQLRTPFQKQLMKLHFALGLYHRLKNSLRPERSEDFAAELELYKKAIPAARVAVQKLEAKEDYNAQDLAVVRAFREQFEFLSHTAYPLAVPPEQPNATRDNWINVGASLLATGPDDPFHPAVHAYAAMATAYRRSETAAFNQQVAEYRQWLDARVGPELAKSGRESFYNRLQPFYRSLLMYLVAFLFGCAFWFNFSEGLRRTAVNLMAVALVVHSAGLIFRMLLEGRPPVTNLYSSAVFIGWGAVGLGLVLERIFRDGIGLVSASAIGVITQIIAHNLALGGDTMEMLRAVLDTNFWLATHVVVITLGYSATYVAGMLAIIYVVRGVLTSGLAPATAKALARMVYGVICFATLFSFTGTVLGGIWADQSWGRFWGWDAKENGALIIVIWNVIILHARWGGMIKERGLMNMAIFGNIVTSWSWFGVNMLGIGLHSYGFMDAAFKWLVLFATTQAILIGLGSVPDRFWRSFRRQHAGLPPTPAPVAS